MAGIRNKAVELAAYLGVTEATVSRYRRGRLPDSMEVLGWIADRYGTSIDYLIGRTDRRTYESSLEQEAAKLGFSPDDVIRILKVIAEVQKRQREE